MDCVSLHGNLVSCLLKLPLKSSSGFFHRKQTHVDEINVQINGTQIERVESFNFLGIMLDENLTEKSQIEVVGKKNLIRNGYTI